MRGWGATARRLAIASLLALALLAAGVMVPDPGRTAAGAGRGGWGQPGAPDSAFGYAPPPGGLGSGLVVASSDEPMPYLLLDDPGQAC
jgi:hypothetical protein